MRSTPFIKKLFPFIILHFMTRLLEFIHGILNFKCQDFIYTPYWEAKMTSGFQIKTLLHHFEREWQGFRLKCK